jgi:hypothetical protein
MQLNEQFLRMQKLAGIQPVNNEYDETINILTELYLHEHYYSKGILKENINEGKIIDFIKKKFSSLKDNSKKFVKKSLEDIKKIGDQGSILKYLKTFPSQFKSVPEFLKTFQIVKCLQNQKNLKENEEDIKKISNEKDLKNLKPNDKFIWDGETIEEVEWNGQPIANIKAKPGLLKGVTYIVNPEESYDSGNGPEKIPAIIASLDHMKDVNSSGTGMWIRGLFNKYPRFQKYLTLLIAAFGIFNVVGGNIAPTAATIWSDSISSNVLDGGPALADDDFQGQPGDIDNSKVSGDGDGDNNPEIPTGEDGSSSGDNNAANIKQISANNVDIGSMDIANSDNNATSIQTYPTGEGTLSQEDITTASNQLSNDILKNLNNDIKESGDNNIDSITLKITYASSVSHNDNPNSNLANDGGDVNEDRLNSSKNIAEQTKADLEKTINKAYPDAKLTITLEEVNTTSGINNQEIQTAADKLPTQASFQAAESSMETSKDPNTTIQLKSFQFLYAPTGTGTGAKPSPTGEEPTGEKATGEKATGEKATGEKATNVTPTNAKQYLDYFPKLNRNGQLAVILKTISPKTDIFSKLGKKTITSFTDTELTDEKITDDTTKKIAQLIINSRKNPDTFLKKMSQLAGIKFGTRAKAVMTKPGQKYQPSSQIQQENITLLSLLNEAQIDDLFTSLKITPSQVQQYKVEIAAFLGSMYANDENKALSILDTNSLTSEELTKLKNLGFSPQGAQGEYVWLGDKTKDQIQKPSADLKIKNPEQADSDKTGELIDKNPALKAKLKVIKTTDQLGDLVFGIITLFSNKALKTFAKQKTMFSTLYSRVNTEFPNANRLKQAFTKAKDKFNSTYPNAADYKEETQDQDPTAIKTAQTDASKKEKSFTQDTTVLGAFTVFNSNPALTAAIQRNNTEEEVYQLILRYLIPYLGPYFYSQKDDSEGTYNRGEGGQFAKKTLRETPLNEQFLRMQKLAGLITESQYQARKK